MPPKKTPSEANAAANPKSTTKKLSSKKDVEIIQKRKTKKRAKIKNKADQQKTLSGVALAKSPTKSSLDTPTEVGGTQAPSDANRKRVNADKNPSNAKKARSRATQANSPKKSDLDKAMEVLSSNCDTTTLAVHPTMIPALAPLTIVENPSGVKEIQYNNVDCNHNTPDLSKGYQIMNNLLNNPLHTNNEHERTLGGDLQFLAIGWDKVCSLLPLGVYTPNLD